MKRLYAAFLGIASAGCSNVGRDVLVRHQAELTQREDRELQEAMTGWASPDAIAERERVELRNAQRGLFRRRIESNLALLRAHMAIAADERAAVIERTERLQDFLEARVDNDEKRVLEAETRRRTTALADAERNVERSRHVYEGLRSYLDEKYPSISVERDRLIPASIMTNGYRSWEGGGVANLYPVGFYRSSSGETEPLMSEEEIARRLAILNEGLRATAAELRSLEERLVAEANN